MVKAGLVEVRSRDLYVDKMPLARLLSCAILVRITEFVRPGCGSGDVMCGERVGIGRKQSTDFLADGGFEIGLRHQGDNLVSFITPGLGRTGRHGVEHEGNRNDHQSTGRCSHSISPNSGELLVSSRGHPVSRLFVSAGSDIIAWRHTLPRMHRVE
jgi:hypothetical protein